MRNERFVSVILALLLGGLAAATVWSGHQSLEPLENFKVEIPPLSLLALRWTGSWIGIFSLVLLAPLILLVALGNLPVRGVGLFVVLGLGALNFGLLLPQIALFNTLTGGDGTNAPTEALVSPLLSPAALILAGNLVVAAAFALGAMRLWRVDNHMDSLL